MLQTIIAAIKNKQVLSLTYKGLERRVEPHAVGISLKGNNVLRCYQIAGVHTTPGHEWDLLAVEKIEKLSVTGTTFAGTRSGYSRGDKGMSSIYAEL